MLTSPPRKLNSIRPLLQRNFNSCSRKIKEATYKTYVSPIVKFATTAWDPHTQRNIRKLEQVQISSARYVTSIYDCRSSVTALLKDLQWPTLQSRRCQSRLAMLCRIRWDLVDIKWKQHLTESTSITRYHKHRQRMELSEERPKRVCLTPCLQSSIEGWHRLAYRQATFNRTSLYNVHTGTCTRNSCLRTIDCAHINQLH